MKKHIENFVHIVYNENKGVLHGDGIKSVFNIPFTWEIKLEYYMW